MIDLFDSMKIEKKIRTILPILQEASSSEEIIALSLRIVAFPSENQKIISYNQYTLADSYIYFIKKFQYFLDQCEMNDQIPFKIAHYFSLQANCCINSSIIHYLGFSESQMKSLRQSRSDFYYYATRSHYESDPDDYNKAIEDAFSLLLQHDVKSPEKINVAYEDASPLIGFKELMDYSLEAHLLTGYISEQIKKVFPI